MEDDAGSKLHTLQITTTVFICLGTFVFLLALRALSDWCTKRFLLVEPDTSRTSDADSETFVRNLSELPVACWLYPLGTMVALVLLFTPEVEEESNPLKFWANWTDNICAIYIGFLLSQVTFSTLQWDYRGLRFEFRISVLHYATACGISITCLACHQLAPLVLVGIVTQLPSLFSIICGITSRSVCPCLWVFNWLLWVVSQTLCCFAVPGFFIIKPLVEFGISQFSTTAIGALFWAIFYFGILFLWESHRPFKALVKECTNNREEELLYIPAVPNYNERTPLVACQPLSAKDTSRVPPA